MAAMAISQPAPTQPVITIGQRHQSLSWPLWLAASVFGAVLGAWIGWFASGVSEGALHMTHRDAAYLGLIITTVIASGAQWVVLRRSQVDAFWWVPATVAATFIAEALIVPGVVTALMKTGLSLQGLIVASGALVSLTSGLIVGAAQALVLSRAGARAALAWAIMTAIGGAVAGTVTAGALIQTGALPLALTVSFVATMSALGRATFQVPVLLRLAR